MTDVVSNLFVRTALDAGLALHNVGGAGVIKIFTGAAPATCETADTGTLLATLTPSATAFPGSVDNSAGGATATANAVTSGTGVNAPTGLTAGYYRSYPHTPTTTNALTQGSVGASGSGANFIINSTTITTGDTVACTSWTETLPDGSGTD